MKKFLQVLGTVYVFATFVIVAMINVVNFHQYFFEKDWMSVFALVFAAFFTFWLLNIPTLIGLFIAKRRGFTFR